MRVEQLTRRSADFLTEAVEQCVQPHLHTAKAIGIALRSREQVEHGLGKVGGIVAHRQCRQCPIRGSAQLNHVHARRAQYVDHAWRTFEQPHQQVQGQHLGVLALVGNCLRCGNVSLGFLGIAAQRQGVGRIAAGHGCRLRYRNSWQFARADEGFRCPPAKPGRGRSFGEHRSGAYLSYVSTGAQPKRRPRPGWSFDHSSASSAGAVRGTMTVVEP